MNFENIPQELKALKQWTVYKSYPDTESGKYKKVIISPVTRKFAKSNEPESWADYETAERYCKRYGYPGLTFALNGGITFIDLDHAADKATGEVVSPEARRLLNLLPDTYTERSVSGTGIHILLKGGLPEDALKRNDDNGIEMYDSRRFVCMTGSLLNGCRTLKDYSDKITVINYEFVGRRPPRAYYPQEPSNISDNELVNEILISRQGDKFRRLYNGDISGYPSHSHADSAFVFMLAWWTRDPSQIDGIFRSSGLYRDKWNAPRGNSTYGALLIDEALGVVAPRTARQQKRRQITTFEM
jgi:putative DNA primase/helicase